MNKSRRAKRMERNHKKAKTPELNLVALMDIFTILVFFLLVNSSSAKQLPARKELTLPVSISQKEPSETLTIEITKSDILVQGVKVAALADVEKNQELVIQKLKEELVMQSSRSAEGQTPGEHEFKVTILGDENISYDLVKKILTTCQQASYTKISFAALQTTAAKLH
jgi:biopolymer transport protein ExbD